MSSLTASFAPSPSPSPSPVSSSSLGASSLGAAASSVTLLSLSWKWWVLIILGLAFLGFNVFAVLAKGTQTTANVLEVVLGLFGREAVSVAEQAVKISAEGTRAGADAISSAATGTINTIQRQQNQAPSSSSSAQLQRDLNAPSSSSSSSSSSQEVEPDDSRSTIQSTGKAGWCFVGESNHARTCAQVGVNDTCMSGDIFPSQAICVNPNLRQ